MTTCLQHIAIISIADLMIAFDLSSFPNGKKEEEEEKKL